MKTPAQHNADRKLIQAAMDELIQIMPNHHFVVLGVEPDGTPGGYHLKLVTSLDADTAVMVMKNALKAARKNIARFRAQRESAQ